MNISTAKPAIIEQENDQSQSLPLTWFGRRPAGTLLCRTDGLPSLTGAAVTVHLPRISRGAGVTRDPDKGHAAVTAHARRAGADGAAPLSGGITQTGVTAAVLPFAARQT